MLAASAEQEQAYADQLSTPFFTKGNTSPLRSLCRCHAKSRLCPFRR